MAERSVATQDETEHGAVALLLERVGQRVRQAREQRGISRRVLSDKSGVSPRYLAQLESGAGNISIGLLCRVAEALDLRIEWLVGADDPWTSDVLHMAEMYRQAEAPLQAQVRDLLLDGAPGGRRAQRVCLVGLRGAGKSTLGRMAGAALDVPFVELNQEIADIGGMPVAEIMALYGQEGYRKLEADALDRVVATHDQVILAVGGGIVAEPATYNRLLSHFHTIWLKAAPEDHMARVRAQGDERPMAGQPEAMAQLKSILQAREALYERAHAHLETSGATLRETRDRLLALIAAEHFLG
ncbi:helix-turn-helix transcriptional regulator [Mameliella sediminis]|uniref:helix-turn-helix transcriptional regulator n=1 Tax=Mameliella sediminis TaxID=2836866 RepID=UPI001C48BB40|nr:helix-turn-helix transcriptional regulator [Mameliella sediminis]MBY6161730.1 helix-turn-helix transcriptional regulator [Mameliella alba]MBY6170200.1 helix-turn-helix transcriptional regulator [Mameliella alba]MBY6175219.1 helix-turn-helix transcriptional regulator [Mameliella alba]